MTGDSSLPHWRIQWPLTRAPALRLVTDDDYFGGITAVCGAVVHCMTLPPADPAEVADLQRRHPPRGLPRPRLRPQWPAVRIPAGMRLVGLADYMRQERAIVAGSRRGLGIGETGSGPPGGLSLVR
jgi:hypothetical protein